MVTEGPGEGNQVWLLGVINESFEEAATPSLGEAWAGSAAVQMLLPVSVLGHAEVLFVFPWRKGEWEQAETTLNP